MVDEIIKLKAEIFDLIAHRDTVLAQAKQIEEQANAQIQEKLVEIEKLQKEQEPKEE